MATPYQNTTTVKLISDRIRDLAHKKTQAEIANEAGFTNEKMLILMKDGWIKVPLDRVPSLAKALEVDPEHFMRLTLEQALGEKTTKSILEILCTPATVNERGRLADLRYTSDDR